MLHRAICAVPNTDQGDTFRSSRTAEVRSAWPPVHTGSWMDSGSGDQGLVSVVIPTYNRSRLLVEALDSVAIQTYRPIEILVVDDGSTDGTEAHVRSWIREQADDPCLTVEYICQKNQGPSAARNRGLLHSQGEYIQFLDSDDQLHAERFAAHVKRLRKLPSKAFVFSDIAPLTEEEGSRKTVVDEWERSKTRLKNIPNSACRCTYTRDLVRAVGPWNESIPLWEDWEYSVRLASLRVPFSYLGVPLYLRRMHPEDQLSDRNTTEEGVGEVLDAMETVDNVVKAVTGRGLPANALGMHLRGVTQALRYGTDEQVRRAFASWKRHEPRTAQHVRVRALEVLFRALGRRPARWLYEAYARLRASA